jgi:hypothetical protein
MASMPPSIPPAPADSPLISWACYEPAGNRVELTEADLQHVLLIGSTGSGKSTLLIDATQQLIAHKARSPENKLGMLILDAKSDDLVERVQDAALRAGRARDVLLFGPCGDHGLDLFGGGLRSLDDVERITRQVLLGVEKFGGDNAFWWQSTAAMLNAGFTLLAAAEQTISFAATVEFLRRWFLSPETPSSLLDLVKRLKSRGARQNSMLGTALDQVRLWQNLDPRTKSNLQSCLLLALQPLTRPAAARCFNPQSGNVASPAQAATEGRVCVVSINAMAEPDLARFFFRLAKQLFFDAVQQRRQPARLCGLVADEFPLVLTREDAEQLATVRSKRSFVIAATQGLHGLSERIGIGQTRALVNHFNTTIFMRTREAETAVHAFFALGTRQERPPRRRREKGGLLGLMFQPDPEPAATEVPVCPIGALGQLSPHQAYIAFADGRRTELAVWFVPWFEQVQAGSLPEPKALPKFSAGHLQQLMQQAGFSVQWSAEVVMQACALRRRRRRKTMRQVSAFFLSQGLVPEGLDELPNCWLGALPGILWSLREPHWTRLPFFIDRVAVQDGLLLLHFAQEQPDNAKVTSWDRIRVAVNSSVYPSRWRSLSRWHIAKLRQMHPELRPVLDGPGQEIP